MTVNLPIVIVLVVFIAGMLGIGVYLNRRMKSTNDFWVGGRCLGPWVTAISYVGTYYSTVALVGGPSQTYKYGLGFGLWQVAGTTWLFGLLPFLLMAVPVRRMSSRLGAVTVPGWLAARFGSEKIKIYALILITLMMIPYGTAVMRAAGVLLQVVAGIPYFWGIALTGLTVAVYLALSGYLGLAWNDTIQGWIMLAGALMIAPLALGSLGGGLGLFQTLAAEDPRLLEIPGALSWGQFISLSCVWGFICWGQPQLITRFYGIRSSRMLGVSMVVVVVFTTIMASGFHINGLIARAMYGDRFLGSLDLVIPTIAADTLPLMAAAIFMSAAVSAAMSTLASTGLVAGSALAKDLYEDVLRKGRPLEPQKALNISRLFTFLAMFLSFLLAVNPPGIVFTLSIFAQGTVAATLTGSMFYALYWKRANWQGCLASMVSGTTVTVMWYLMKGPWVHPYVPGILTSLVVFPVVALLTPPPPQETIDRAFGRQKALAPVPSLTPVAALEK